MIRNLLTVSLLTLIVLGAPGCRRCENTVELLSLTHNAPLGDQPLSIEAGVGDILTIRGVCRDTGAMSYVEVFTPTGEGVYRTVYYLAERRAELDGEFVELVDCVVVETQVYGYALKLEPNTVSVLDKEPPVVVLPAETSSVLSELDLDAMSKHPEHNGDYHPEAAELAALRWEMVDYETGTGIWLLRSERLSLPPFADPRLERWLIAFISVSESGAPLRLWIGVRGAFAE